MSIKPQISFEFFPPKTVVDFNKLCDTYVQLAPFNPAFFSVTFGAGGTTQTGTLETVLHIQKNGQIAVPHLSCVGLSKESLLAILKTYQKHNIRHLIVLRGDLPSGVGQYGEFQYASQLVAFIRDKTDNWFHIFVAAYPEFHPQAHSPRDDLQRFVEKIRAGANTAITQYFFNKDAYFRFIDEVSKFNINTLIFPGIMPIINSHKLFIFSDKCGADIPRWIKLRLASYGDDIASIRAFGLDVVCNLCHDLLNGGAPGIHFYTLNQKNSILKICEQLQIAHI